MYASLSRKQPDKRRGVIRNTILFDIYASRMKSRDLIKAKSAERTDVREHFERMSKPGSSFDFNIINVFIDTSLIRR
jgi:hypothetical protein